MSEFKGTEGAWRSELHHDIEVHGDLHIVYAGGDSPEKAYHVAYSAGWVDNETSKQEAEANARLICSAPDLLKALQGMIKLWDAEIHDRYDGTSSLYDLLSGANPARAAIAKALGEKS